MELLPGGRTRAAVCIFQNPNVVEGWIRESSETAENDHAVMGGIVDRGVAASRARGSSRRGCQLPGGARTGAGSRVQIPHVVEMGSGRRIRSIGISAKDDHLV